MDIQLNMKNRANFPREELEKHRGKYVAYSPDGSFIVASHEDFCELCAMVDASEYDPEECVISGEVLFDDCDSYLGSSLFFGNPNCWEYTRVDDEP